jgi:UPF0755 protein
MKKVLKRIIILAIIIAVFFLIYFYRAISNPTGQSDEIVYFTIEIGEGVNQISNALAEDNLIDDQFAFETYIWLQKSEGSLMAGEHKLDRGMNIKEIMVVLKRGDSVDKERTITVIEGWTAKEIAEYLAGQGFFTAEDFLGSLDIKKWRKDYSFLSEVNTKNIEGFLFPDTYRVFATASSDDIIKKMLDNFDRKLIETAEMEIELQGKSVFEVVTLASIVEREALTVADKKMVAGIFLNRLDIGMALQSDATVNYITGAGRRRPTFDDLEVDSRYNTYKYAGLTPGPISNPGIDAIMAVIYPTNSDYLYFLMDEAGTAYYAETFSGHQANVRNYLN